MSKKIIFTSGMPRACSTLMTNILRQNPDIMGGETSPLLEYVYGARANFSSVPEVKASMTEDIMHKSFLNFCRQGMLGYAEEMCGENSKIYLDKSRGWVHYAPFLWELFPDAKIILCVRDIRGVLASFEKKWRENPSILDNRDNPNMQQFITVDQRINSFLDNPPLGLSLKRIYNAWQTKTLEKMHFVKAEELSKNPKEVMQGVYKFIEEPYYECDYTNIVQKTQENDRIADFGIYGDHKIRNVVEPLKKDYNELLTKGLANSVKENYKWFYEAFDYF